MKRVFGFFRFSREEPVWLEHFRERIARVDAQPQLAILGLFTGAFSGAVIVLFRFAIEMPENALSHAPGWLLALLPLAGSILLAIIYLLVREEHHSTGVSHVISRLNKHQGFLPWPNAMLQFAAGIIAIGSGHSVGREGPAIHLGAAGGSYLGDWLRLPHNSMRILVACGAAAAIAASFNTPLAGVIFSMEVIIMEYSISTFIPVILASVVATVISRAAYGDSPAFIIPDLHLNSAAELPWIILTAIITGIVACLFIQLVTHGSAILGKLHLSARLLVAGIITSIAIYMMPEIAGTSYQLVNQTLASGYGITLLASFLVAKLLITSIAVSAGVPGGVIGPTMVFGACVGGIMGAVAERIAPGLGASPGFYVLLGMGAMMSAIINAPLAALIALLELTATTKIIFPGMLAIVVANLVNFSGFRQKPVFQLLLETKGLAYRQNPLQKILQRTSVQSILEPSCRRVPRVSSIEELLEIEQLQHTWLAVEDEDRFICCLYVAEVLRFIKSDEFEGDSVDLMEIPADREQVATVEYRASLDRALQIMDEKDVNILCVLSQSAPGITRLRGLVTREAVNKFYY